MYSLSHLSAKLAKFHEAGSSRLRWVKAKLNEGLSMVSIIEFRCLRILALRHRAYLDCLFIAIAAIACLICCEISGVHWWHIVAQDLNNLASIVRRELPKLTRAVLGTLITLDVHGRDMVSEMVKNQVGEPSQAVTCRRISIKIICKSTLHSVVQHEYNQDL